MVIQKVTHLPPQISALEKEAVAEGFRFITLLTSQWHCGTNRFDAPGECLMAAYLDRQLVGIGGLSVDPFTPIRTGRLRRIYVTPASRGQQIGRRLVSAYRLDIKLSRSHCGHARKITVGPTGLSKTRRA